jgi:hypothetical protein
MSDDRKRPDSGLKPLVSREDVKPSETGPPQRSC